jgi:uncharacterized protein (TIGR03435 family)
MRYAISQSVASVLAVCAAALAQTPAARPQFEVASIKPAPPLNPADIAAGKVHLGMTVDGNRVRIGYMSLTELIVTAFKVKRHQVSGPDWMNSERFDIVAKMPDKGTKEQAEEMLQGLVAERFKLVFHKEPREQSVYALVVAKGGPKLKESAKEEDTPPARDDKGTTINFGAGTMRQSGNGMIVTARDQKGAMKMTMVEGKMRMESTQTDMPRLCDLLTGFVGKPVVDFTELKGLYDVTLEFSLQELMAIARRAGVAIPGTGMMGAPGGSTGNNPADAASDPTTAGSVFTSIQQLGLKLESRKAPVDTIIVDQIEKTPTEN